MSFPDKTQVKVIVIGAGQRGQAYTQFLPQIKEHAASVVAIAEPNTRRARLFGRRHGLSSDCLYASYTDVAALGPRAHDADAVFISTQDSMHLPCVQAFSALGYHILCEKPMATTLQDCLLMRNLLHNASPRIFGMGHVLRYSPYNMALKQLLHERVIGDICNIVHVEPVGHAHFAHSYVRGNWRNEASSACLLLTKSCHDIDLLQWLLQDSFPNRHIVEPTRVASIGSLSHFRRARKPKEATSASKCLSCPLAESCAYSAKKIYLDAFTENGELRGFQKTLTDVEEKESIIQALQETHYGTCVYEMDNDVCDNQIVMMQYDAPHGMINVSLTVTAFSSDICVRKTTIYGTQGQIDAYGKNRIVVHDFASGQETVHMTKDFKGSRESNSHGGGDFGLVSQFIKAVAAVKQGMDVAQAQDVFIGCTVEDMYTSHAIVFRADMARRSG